jgi:hypothetical protein
MIIDLNDYPLWSIFLVSFVSILAASESGAASVQAVAGATASLGLVAGARRPAGRTIRCFGMDAAMPTLATIGFLQHHPSPPLPYESGSRDATCLKDALADLSDICKAALAIFVAGKIGGAAVALRPGAKLNVACACDLPKRWRNLE